VQTDRYDLHPWKNWSDSIGYGNETSDNVSVSLVCTIAML